MSRGSVNKIYVPDELREILLDFTVNYLLEQPQEDVVTYACDFFNRLRESRKLADIRSPSVGEESVISEDGQYYLSMLIRVFFLDDLLLNTMLSVLQRLL